MDCVINKLCIPKSDGKVFVLKPSSKVKLTFNVIVDICKSTWINGLAKSYEEKYYDELIPYISESKFIDGIRLLNSNLESMWPCDFCFALGYIFAVPTAGLSFLCTFICIKEAKERFDKKLSYLNETVFNPSKLNIEFKSNCLTSWLQVEIVDYQTLSVNGSIRSNNSIELSNK